MKKFSELIRNNNTQTGVANESELVNPVFESNEMGEIIGDNGLAEDIINAPFVKNPDIDVDANPKIKKLADTFISLVNRKCKWNAIYHPFLKNIDGVKSVLIMSGVKKGECVTITPIGSGNTSVLRYYFKYDLFNDNQTANYTISSLRMGTVKMFNLLFDIINNPSLYTSGLYEKKGDDNYQMINEKINAKSVMDVKPAYDSIDKTPIYASLKKFVESKGINKRNIGNWITYQGYCDFVGMLSELENPSPYVVSFDIIRRSEQGEKYRLAIADTETGIIRDEAACAIVRLAFADKTVGMGVEITSDTDVEVVDNANVSKAPWTYRGMDVSFLASLGIDFDRFKKQADIYFDTLDKLKRRLTKMILYCQSPRIEKLKKLNIGAQAVFVSGIGGIGKSETWETLKREMSLTKKDYAEKGATSVATVELYKFIYENNGKILVFDDTPDMFDTAFKVSFWKHVLEPKGDFVEISVSSGMADENSKGKFYSVKDCEEGGVVNYKKMYYKECPQERNKAIIRANTGNFGRYNQQNQHKPNNDEQKAKTSASLLPDTMKVMSRFLFITNLDVDELKKMLKSSWTAIRSRTEFFRIAPPKQVLWARIKAYLLNVKETNNPNSVVPPQCVDEVIDIIENEFKNRTVSLMTWRIFTSGTLAEDFQDNEDWQSTLLTQIRDLEEVEEL